MSEFLQSFWKVCKQQRFNILSMVLVITAWIILAEVVYLKYLDLFVYAVFGYCWLGGVVVPWVETKLENLFK